MCSISNDIIILIDGSSSFSNFNALIEAIEYIARGLDFGLQAAQVGILQFSDGVTNHIALGSTSIREELFDEISAIKSQHQSGNLRNTHTGIQAAVNQIEGRGRVGTRNTIVLITFGEPTHQLETITVAETSRIEQNITMVGIGISLRSNNSILPIVVGSSENVFYVEAVNEIESIGRYILGALCRRKYCSVPFLLVVQ